jgi:hypothetical protein
MRERLPHGDEPARTAVRQFAQGHGVHQSEHGGGGADADGEHRHAEKTDGAPARGVSDGGAKIRKE